MKKLKLLWLSFLFVLCVLGCPDKSFGEEVLPPGLIIGDTAGLYADDTGKYYIDLADVLPGKQYKKEITIRSLDLETPFELGLLVSKVEAKGSIDWNKHITLTLQMDGKQLYKGPLLGDGHSDWTKQPLVIGTCKYGTDQHLEAIFDVDTQLTTNDFLEVSELQYYWTFVGTKKETTPKTTPSTPAQKEEKIKGKLPSTGELQQWLYNILAGILLLLIGLFLWRKGKEDEKN